MVLSGDAGRWRSYEGVCRSIYRIQNRLRFYGDGFDRKQIPRLQLRLHRLEMHAMRLERKLTYQDE